MKTTTATVDETRALGASVAASARPGDVYALEGDLGTGKTEFVRGFVAYFSAAAVVKSPSFSILNIYDTGRFTIYHFDFYRIAQAAELTEVGFDEYVSGVPDDGICLIEWGTLFPGALPAGTQLIRFKDAGNSTREIDLPENEQ